MMMLLSTCVCARAHAQASKTKKKEVLRVGQPTKEDLEKQQETIEAAYGAQTSSDVTEDETIPVVITDRMLKRVLTFAGVPVALGLLLFPCFWYLKVRERLAEAPTARGSRGA